MTRRQLAVGGAAALSVALGAGAWASGAEAPTAGRGDVPITQRAIAAVALDHLPGRPDHLESTWTDRRSPSGLLGADLRYGYGGEDDGDLVRVTISPEVTPHPCRGDGADGCVQLSAGADNQADGTAYLLWDRVEPEEDPGYVAVLLQRGDEQVVALTAGETIRRDPRRQDLRVPVPTLEELVRDDRLHLAVTQDVVDAGERLEDWSGGEPDPHAYDLLPATDEALAVAYPFLNGGYLSYRHPRPSPLAREFGAGAVGGLVHRTGDGDLPARDIEVLASRTGPAWLADDPCATPAFAGHCVRTKGRRGPRYLAWVPGRAAEGGAVWGLQLRTHQVVGIRLSGFRVPESRHRVEIRTEWYLVRRVLGHRGVGLRVEKRLLDFDLEAAQDAGR